MLIFKQIKLDDCHIYLNVLKYKVLGDNIMEKRKHLCLLTTDIKEVHANRIVSGISEQCSKYGYDLSVFTTTTTLAYYNQQYIAGATNIYNLVNFQKFDGIIVDGMFFSTTDLPLLDGIFDQIKAQTDAPVVNISYPYGEYKTIVSQNEAVLRDMCRHMAVFHGYDSFFILTGSKNNHEAIDRLNIIRDELNKLGIDVKPDQIRYGNFWYDSGEALADSIINGETEKPRAVLCTNDHMALGLIQRLTANGYRVPEDVAVIGYESSSVAKLNTIPLSSYGSNDEGTGAEAVDYIRGIIDPDKEIIPYSRTPEECFFSGRSCGCHVKSAELIKALNSSIYRTERNYYDDSIDNTGDIGYLMESYVYEQLCASKNIEECMTNIIESTYLLSPFKNYYLCLSENWNNLSQDSTSGYPEKMKLVVQRSSDNDIFLHTNKNGILFDTSEMLPGLMDYRDEPSVFYFTSIHFNDTIFGYTVLQRDFKSPIIGITHRNWVRFICSSLEMIRMRDNYFNMSLKDHMTGLFNKRGMYENLDQMLPNLSPNESIYVAVIDMDGLKFINDTYGHVDGDLCIKKLAQIINSVTEENEFCVRAGGDEFYIIGSGKYTDEICQEKLIRFEKELQANSDIPDREYKLSASMGNTIWTHRDEQDIDSIIKQADERMYAYKVLHKKNR